MDRNDPLSLAEDERAQIPFAVIGVLLLVTSVSIIVVLETRSEPEVDTDAAQAYDRTSSAVRSVVQGATSSALQRAAAQPVTVPNRSTSTGQALAAGPSGGTDSDEVFSRYVQLRVYLALQERLDDANQSIRDDTVTRVSMPEYDDPADAIDATTLHVGGDQLDYGDPGGADLPYGAVRVTVPDVEVVVERDGQVVGTRTQDYTVTVGSTAFALHDRTNRYEDALNTNLGNETGFARHLSARLTRIGWQRGRAQANGSPVAQVLADRHLETLANDALYATQRDVFGNEDPYADRQLARSYGCTLAADHRAVYDDPTGGSDDLDPVLGRVDDPDFCSGANATYADMGGTLQGAEPPTYTDLAGPTDYLEQTETIDLDAPASAALGNLSTNGAIEAAIDRAYEVDVRVGSDTDRTIPVGDPDAENTELYASTVTVQEPEQLIRPSASGRTRSYYRVHVIFSGLYDRGGVMTNVRYDTNLTIRGEHSPSQRVDELGVDRDYEQGPSDAPDVLFGTNYRGVPEAALEASLAGVDDADNASQQLERHLRNNDDDVLDADDLVEEATVNGGDVTVQATPNDPARLRAWLFQDLQSLEGNLSAVSRQYQRHELLEGTEPLDELDRTLDDDERWVYTHVDRGSYRNVPDLARAEARNTLVQRLRDRVDSTRLRHRETLDELDGRSRTHAAANLTEVTTFTRTQLNGTPYGPSPNHPEHAILSDATMTPDGEPTYVTFDRIDAAQVPAVENASGGFAPAATRHASVYAAPYDHELPGTGSESTVQLRTAGEVLRAGNAAGRIEPGRWSGRTDALDASLRAEIDAIVDDAARDAARPFPTVSRRTVASAIRAELSGLGPTERQAILLSSDEAAIQDVADGVAGRLEDGEHPDYRYWRGARHVHVESAVRSGLLDAIGSGYVDAETGSDTRTLGRALRTAIDDSASVARDERRLQAGDSSLSNVTTTETAGPWLRSNLSGEVAPGSVSAGITSTNYPQWDLLTANLWTVDLRGEYPRFVVRSTGSQRTGSPTEYVREDRTVHLSYDGRSQGVGRTEALDFESRTVLLVAVPSESFGVGDRTDTITECSETYDRTGALSNLTATGPGCAPP